MQEKQIPGGGFRGANVSAHLGKADTVLSCVLACPVLRVRVPWCVGVPRVFACVFPRALAANSHKRQHQVFVFAGVKFSLVFAVVLTVNCADRKQLLCRARICARRRRAGGQPPGQLFVFGQNKWCLDTVFHLVLCFMRAVETNWCVCAMCWMFGLVFVLCLCVHCLLCFVFGLSFGFALVCSRFCVVFSCAFFVMKKHCAILAVSCEWCSIACFAISIIFVNSRLMIVSFLWRCEFSEAVFLNVFKELFASFVLCGHCPPPLRLVRFGVVFAFSCWS